MISIIVPVYNAEKYLALCLHSLLKQTVKDIEIIVVDDDSTDDSLFIAYKYALKDKRVRVFTHQQDGQSVARNYGIKQAKGEYIAFVDADDLLLNDWCEQHLKAIEGVDYVQSGYARIKNENKQLTLINSKSPLHRYRFISPCMRLYRRSAIKPLRFKKGMIYEDVAWSADLWLTNATCRTIRYVGYIYTLNPNSTTSSPHPEDRKKILCLLKEKYKKATFKGKLILLYTIIRLRLHFLLR